MGLHIKRIILIALSVEVSVLAATWAAETFFFDKFIFDKSTVYGYPTKNSSLYDFGKRAEDLLALQARLKSSAEAALGVLGAASDKPFTIAVIGDSYVWGQGLRNENRFAYLLENKLNTIMPVKVMSFGQDGSDAFDYYLMYRNLQKAMPNIDLYVFGLVENDLMINPESEDEQLKRGFMTDCQKPVSFNQDTNDPTNSNRSYEGMLQESYSDSFGNQCVFQKVLHLFPKKNALYLVMEYLKTDQYIQKYIQPFEDNGYLVINPRYESYLRADEYPVSKQEGHPSKKMNQTYTDVLFKEIQKTDSFIDKTAAYLASKK